MGAGDLKLISMLLIYGISVGHYAAFFMGFAGGALATSVLWLIYFRSFRISVPLAPAITTGFFASLF